MNCYVRYGYLSYYPQIHHIAAIQSTKLGRDELFLFSLSKVDRHLKINLLIGRVVVPVFSADC